MLTFFLLVNFFFFLCLLLVLVPKLSELDSFAAVEPMKYMALEDSRHTMGYGVWDPVWAAGM